MSALLPVRFPDTTSREVMTRRAWWLLVLNVLVPGSAQLLAGSRRLGRVGVSATLVLWVLALAALAVALWARGVLLVVATNPVALTIIQVLLLGFAALWVLLTLDTLRLTRLVRVRPAARPVIAAVAVLALVASSGGAAYAAHLAGVTRDTISTVFGGSVHAKPIDGRYTIMLLGGDAGPDRMGLRPDSISVLSVDAATGATTIIGLPRNFEQATFVAGSPMFGPYPNGYDCGDECLLGYLYTVGEEHADLYPKAERAGSTAGVEAMRDAVEGITGLTMQFYILVDMQGFEDLINALGGVEITVPERLAYGPVTSTTPYGHFEAGPQRMDGYHALWYARSRFDGSDFDRMRRQREVQEAIIAQMDPANVVTKFEAVAAAGGKVVSTDIPQSMVAVLVELAAKARALPVTTLEIAPPEVNTVTPDYDVIQDLIADTLEAASAASAAAETPEG